FENPGGVDACQTVSVSTAAIARQTASRDEPTVLVDRWHRLPKCQRGELFLPGGENRIGTDHEAACSQLKDAGQGCIQMAFGAGVKDMEVEPEGLGRGLGGA